MQKKILLVPMLVVPLMFSCSCADWLSRQIVGTQDTRVPQEVLTHNENMATKGIAFYESALSKIGNKEDKADNKTILKLANLVDDELARKSKAGEESKVAMIGNTAVRIMAQPEVRAKVEEGMEWTKNTIMAIAGGATGGSGLFGTMLFRMIRGRKRIAKEVLKNRIKTKVLNENPDMIKKVNEVAAHTIVEGEIT